MYSVTGENFELRAELNSEYRDRRSDAIKRVIANMTVGKDVSGLFPDVLKNMVGLGVGHLVGPVGASEGC
jgi:vesicle coat complex subunit